MILLYKLAFIGLGYVDLLDTDMLLATFFSFLKLVTRGKKSLAEKKGNLFYPMLLGFLLDCRGLMNRDRQETFERKVLKDSFIL